MDWDRGRDGQQKRRAGLRLDSVMTAFRAFGRKGNRKHGTAGKGEDRRDDEEKVG